MTATAHIASRRDERPGTSMGGSDGPDEPKRRTTSTRKGLLLLLLGLVILAIPVGLGVVTARSSATVSDTERVGVNRLGAATLRVAVEPEGADTEETAFLVETMLPGDRAISELRIENEGSLPLRYAVTLVGEPSPLTDWLSLDVWSDPRGCQSGIDTSSQVIRRNTMPRPGPNALVGDVGVGLQPGDRQLDPGAQDLLCLAVSLALSTPNDMQNRTFEFDLVIDAEHDLDVDDRPSAGDTDADGTP